MSKSNGYSPAQVKVLEELALQPVRGKIKELSAQWGKRADTISAKLQEVRRKMGIKATRGGYGGVSPRPKPIISRVVPTTIAEPNNSSIVVRKNTPSAKSPVEVEIPIDSMRILRKEDDSLSLLFTIRK